MACCAQELEAQAEAEEAEDGRAAGFLALAQSVRGAGGAGDEGVGFLGGGAGEGEAVQQRPQRPLSERLKAALGFRGIGARPGHYYMR